MIRLLAAILALLAVAAMLTWLIEGYFAAEGIRLGLHGVAATFLVLVFVPATTIGLMRLLRISQDRGFDERADTYARDHGHRREDS